MGRKSVPVGRLVLKDNDYKIDEFHESGAKNEDNDFDNNLDKENLTAPNETDFSSDSPRKIGNCRTNLEKFVSTRTRM